MNGRRSRHSLRATGASGRERERGQALVELLMVMPLLIAILWYMLHVNSAINASIVQQKHVRSHLFIKLFNHPNGPVISEYMPPSGPARAHYAMAVSANVLGGGDAGSATGSIRAPVKRIGIGLNPTLNPSANNDPGEPTGGVLRQEVRIRTAFGICTSKKPTTSGSKPFTDYCGSGN